MERFALEDLQHRTQEFRKAFGIEAEILPNDSKLTFQNQCASGIPLHGSKIRFIIAYLGHCLT